LYISNLISLGVGRLSLFDKITQMNVIVRKEDINDYPEVKNVLDLAFGQGNEGKLVERLRNNPDFNPELSLVAECGKRVIGYILFFPIAITRSDARLISLALAPMAVDPDFQRKGIGKRLVEAGISRARQSGHKSVIVLGHPEYYQRFGFEPASKWNIRPPFEGVPDNAFLAIELVNDGLKDVRGIVQYPEEFNEV
jgi:putative acetyltransferase